MQKRLCAWGCVMAGKSLLTMAALRALALADPLPGFPHWGAGAALLATGVAWLWKWDCA